MQESKHTMSTSTKFTIHEDWTVVILGFLIIGISLFIFLPEVPLFKWTTGTDLITNVFEIKNIQTIGVQFLYFISIGTIGTFLVGKSIKNFILGFPIIYLLTIIALIIAGNSEVKALNLEAVIFSLVIFGYSTLSVFSVMNSLVLFEVSWRD